MSKHDRRNDLGLDSFFIVLERTLKLHTYWYVERML